MFRILAVILAFSTVSPIVTQAQDKKDPQGLAAIRAALVALQNDTSDQYASCTVAGTTGTPSGSVRTFNWVLAGSEYRFEARNDGQVTTLIMSNHGDPVVQSGGSISKLGYHYGVALQTPKGLRGRLQRALATSTISIEYLGTQLVNGKLVFHFRETDLSSELLKTVSGQDWYIDSVTGMPVRLDYFIPSNAEIANDLMPARMEFGEFAQFGPMLLPQSFQLFVSEHLAQSARIQSATCSTTVDPRDFELITGGAQ